MSVCVTQRGESLSLTCCLVTHSPGKGLSFTQGHKEVNQSGNLVQLQHEKGSLFIYIFSPFFVHGDVSFMHHIKTVNIM